MRWQDKSVQFEGNSATPGKLHPLINNETEADCILVELLEPAPRLRPCS